jgi:two-component system OmpR family response regulator
MTSFVHVVEDDEGLRGLILRGLSEEGFEVCGSDGAEAALRHQAERSADAFLIDIGLDDADGRDLCQALRARGVRAPVLFLTALDAMPDRISGFRAGGDDYVTKPFAFSELVARLHALLRRAESDPTEDSSPLRFDPMQMTVACGDTTVALTQTEYRILGALAGRPGETLRRAI